MNANKFCKNIKLKKPHVPSTPLGLTNIIYKAMTTAPTNNDPKNLENNKDITLLASSPTTRYQIFKYQNHAYGIQFHIEIKNTTVSDWGCVPEYKSALEAQFGDGALEKFDQKAKANMKQMNNFSTILYSKFKKEILKI